MSGQWPPGWEDPEDLEAEGLDAETDVRLSEVTAFLAAVPAPALPDGIESRILAALAAESAARAAEPTAHAEDSTATAPVPDEPRILRPRPAARARVRRQDRARRFPRINPALAAWPLAACLFFAGIGYLVSMGGSSSSSSAPYAAGAASSAAAGTEGGNQAGYSASSSGRTAAGSIAAGSFALIRSGTDYQKASLAGQVRAVILEIEKATPTVPSAAPTFGSSSAPASSAAASSAAASSAAASSAAASSAAASASGTGAAIQSVNGSKITSALRSCVVHFTGGAAPLLIDRARYHGTPVYVIASESQVWVVGLGCTAAHPHLIASAPLRG